jgi:hypothetical protein
MKQTINKTEAQDQATIADNARPAVNPMPIEPQPVFGLGRDQCPPVSWSAFAPVGNDQADWGL